MQKKLNPRQETDLRCRKTQVDSQSKIFFQLWNDYNASQVEFREKSKKVLVQQCKITGNTSLSNEQIEEMIDEGKTNIFSNILDQERLARQQLMDLQERHGEFMKLEKQIEEVRDIFMEIAALVESQGEMVDNIYENVTRAGIDVEQGKDHLKKAQDYQKSARKKKLICAGIAVIVFLIILLIILIEFGAFSSSSSPISTTNNEPSKTTVIVIQSPPEPSSINSIADGNQVEIPSMNPEPALEVPDTLPWFFRFLLELDHPKFFHNEISDEHSIFSKA